jgi:hypothetical protein
MKNNFLIIFLIVAFASCEKKVAPIDNFGVTVEYRSKGNSFVTSDKTVNPKDSIHLDFTITAKTDMSFVEVQRNGVRVDTFRLDNFADKKTFSLLKGYMVDSASGEYRYRVLARDKRAIFMGDGGKEFTITVKPDFDFWSDRVLQVPDSTAKTNKAYFSSVDGVPYSFTNGAASSAKIDFGFYWDTTGRGTTVTTDDLKHTIYALNASQTQIAFNDITSWAKNATVFKLISGVNFVTQLRSAGDLQTRIGAAMASGTANKINKLANGNIIGFKTAAGKFGAILVRFITGDSPNATTQMEVDVKVQK